MIYYLSFVIEDKFAGGVYVHADTAGMAVAKAAVLGIDPGGEMAIFPVPSDLPGVEGNMDRLLTREELNAMHPGEITTMGEYRKSRMN